MRLPLFKTKHRRSLASAHTHINETQAQLAETQAQLAETQAQLAVTQLQVTEQHSQLSDMRVSLGDLDQGHYTLPRRHDCNGLVENGIYASELLMEVLERDFGEIVGADETRLLNYFREVNAARSRYNKVFCIGYNKTGTTSLEGALRDLGFRLPQQVLQEKLTSHVLVTGRYDILKRFVAMYDAFQDMPFSQESLYIALDAMFPGSKFILTLRDAEAWYNSLLKFHMRVFGFSSPEDLSKDFWLGRKYLHENYVFENERRVVTRVSGGQILEDWESQYDRDTRIDEFNHRNDQIIRYFRDRPSDLLCIDLSKEVDTSKLCDFLQISNKFVKEFPRLNAAKGASL